MSSLDSIVSSSPCLSETNKTFSEFESYPPSVSPGSEWLNAAKVLMDNREWQEAVVLLKRASQTTAYEALALELLWSCYVEVGDYWDSLKVSESLLRVKNEFSTLFRVGKSHYFLGNWSQALVYFGQAAAVAMTVSSELFDLLNDVGNIYLKRGDIEAARENYHRAYVISPQSPRILVNLGTLAIQELRYDQARQYFADAIMQDPFFGKAWMGQALVHRHFGDLELSRGALRKSLDLAPDNLTAFDLYIDWAIKDGEYSSGLLLISDLEAISPVTARTQITRARLLFLLHRKQEALNSARAALAQDPQLAGAQVLIEALESELANRG